MGMTRVVRAHLRARTRAALGALAVAALLAGCGHDESREDTAKADQLEQAVAPLGIDVDPDVYVSLYGSDGGAVCAEAGDPGALASEAASVVSHRFTLRRTEADADTVAYVRAVISTYCPDELGSFDDYVEGLKVDGRAS